MTNIKPFNAGTLASQHQLKHGSVNQQTAIEEIEELFQVSEDKLDILMRGVGQEMRNGLNVTETGEKQNDLKMIPSFVAGNIKKNLIFFRTPFSVEQTR
jgi:hexokinase